MHRRLGDSKGVRCDFCFNVSTANCRCFKSETYSRGKQLLEDLRDINATWLWYLRVSSLPSIKKQRRSDGCSRLSCCGSCGCEEEILTPRSGTQINFQANVPSSTSSQEIHTSEGKNNLLLVAGIEFRDTDRNASGKSRIEGIRSRRPRD